MWSDEQVEWIGRIGRAAFVLLFLAGEGRPVRAREVSRRLRADYEATRRYLFELAELGAALHTPAGWRPTPAACRLAAAGMSPEGASLRENSGADESRRNAENPLSSGAAGARLSEADRLNALLPRLGEPIIVIKVNQALKDSLLDSFKDPESLILTISPENAVGTRPSQAGAGVRRRANGVRRASLGGGGAATKNVAGEQGSRGAATKSVAGERQRANGVRRASQGCGDGRTEFAERRGGQGGRGAATGERSSQSVAGEEAQDMPAAQDMPGEDLRLAELGQALHRAGILLNPRTRHLFGSNYLTAAHVAGSEHQLKKCKGRNYQPGLLVVALEGIQPGDPPAPVGFDGQNASRYAEWED